MLLSPFSEFLCTGQKSEKQIVTHFRDNAKREIIFPFQFLVNFGEIHENRDFTLDFDQEEENNLFVSDSERVSNERLIG